MNLTFGLAVTTAHGPRHSLAVISFHEWNRAHKVPPRRIPLFIFRCLSVRESLLHGLLEADLVGFQTASRTLHLRQTVSCILALEALPKGIQIEASLGSGTSDHKARFVDVGVFPMGIGVKTLQEKKWV